MKTLKKGDKVTLIRILERTHAISIEEHTIKSSGKQITLFENLVGNFDTEVLQPSIKEIKCKTELITPVIVENNDMIEAFIFREKEIRAKRVAMARMNLDGNVGDAWRHEHQIKVFSSPVVIEDMRVA